MLAWGARCIACAGVHEGIQAARTARQAGEPFHIAVLNPDAPGMEGLVGEHWQTSPDLSGMAQIVLTSGREPRQLRNRNRTGVSYLLKPVVPSKLLSALVGCAHPLPAVPAHQRPTLVASTHATVSSNPGASTLSTASTGALTGRARVLCADDNKINQRLARHLLEKLGCQVDIASNGREAIDLAGSVAYDLIFMDCLMPDTDGFEATKEIRRREPESARCPIIALTANAMRGDRERCLEAGMDDFLSKPVRREDFSRILERYLVRATATG
jgi:two-component system sensor histidine kinase/response regulator